MDGRVGAECRRTYQQRDAPESEDQAEGGTRAGSPGSLPQPVQQDHPARRSCNEQGCDARRDQLLGPDDSAVATEQQERADHERSLPLASRGRSLRMRARPRIEQSAGYQETHCGHQEGGQRVDRVENCEKR